MNCFLEASANTLIALNNSFHLRLRKSVYDMHNQIPLIQLLLTHLSCHMFCGKCFFAFLIAHSVLHLTGYDHMEEEERLRMEKKQKEILEKIQILR